MTLRDDAIAFRGVKSASDIAAMHGTTRNTIIGIWHRAKLPPVPKSAISQFISLKNRGAHWGASPAKPSAMPSPAKLAATRKPRADWWSRKYLMVTE